MKFKNYNKMRILRQLKSHQCFDINEIKFSMSPFSISYPYKYVMQKYRYYHGFHLSFFLCLKLDDTSLFFKPPSKILHCRLEVCFKLDLEALECRGIALQNSNKVEKSIFSSSALEAAVLDCLNFPPFKCRGN